MTSKRKREEEKLESVIKKRKQEVVHGLRDLNIVPKEIREKILERTEGPVVFNVVCVSYSSTQQGLKDDRTRIAWLMDGRRNTGEFAAPCQLPMRNGRYPVTMSLFNDGSIVVVGAANENLARQTIWTTLARIGQETNNWYHPCNIEVVNIHSTVYMFCELDLPRLAESHPLFYYQRADINMVKIKMSLDDSEEATIDDAKVEDEEPIPKGKRSKKGVVKGKKKKKKKKKRTQVTALVYDSGSIVLTGARERSQLVKAKEKIVPYVANFVVRFVDSPEERARIKERVAQITARMMPPTADL